METEASNENNMFLNNESCYNFEETVDKLSGEFLSANWKISVVHDLQEILHKNGKEVLPVKIIEICKPEYSGRLLEKDAERMYSPLMPCRVSIYETSDGKTYISRMNSGLMASRIGGLVDEVMSIAFDDMERILVGFIKNDL